MALYHLHSRGIVHRDIKPENVVFADEASAGGARGSGEEPHAVKLIDFGTAVALEEEGAKIRSGGRIGTWSYWAPEQLNNQPYDFAVDSARSPSARSTRRRSRARGHLANICWPHLSSYVLTPRFGAP